MTTLAAMTTMTGAAVECGRAMAAERGRAIDVGDVNDLRRATKACVRAAKRAGVPRKDNPMLWDQFLLTAVAASRVEVGPGRN